MKNLILKFVLISAGAMLCFMLVNIGFGVAQEPTNPQQNLENYLGEFCFDGKVSEMSSNQITKTYIKTTNDFFNENIEYIMTHIDEDFPAPTLDGYENSSAKGLCKDDDYSCKMLAVCQGNRSAYCLAVNLTGINPNKYNSAGYDLAKLDSSKFNYLRYSYFCYHAALNSKKNDVLEESGQSILARCPDSCEENDDACEELQSHPICRAKSRCGTAQTPECQADIDQLVLAENQGFTLAGLSTSVSEKVSAIENELNRAKNALDTTVDTYSQLQSAWKMHLNYVDVFQALVKYRDHLVDIRQQTDNFPSRFIDATTTKCL
jgi:hypothetical protein